jgi:hypothetical protein
MGAWIPFNESVRNHVCISCALKKILPGACSSPRLHYLQDYGVLPLSIANSFNILMPLSVLRFALTFFISAVLVCYMLPRLSRLLTYHNDVIDAGQTNWLGSARIRLSHLQKGTFYIQIFDKHHFQWFVLFDLYTRWYLLSSNYRDINIISLFSNVTL